MSRAKRESVVTNRDSDKFMLRLPGDMRTVIGEIAASSGRSMNAEIVMRLNASLAASGESDGDRYTRITLRIPKALHASLAETAAATSKSLNAEIIGQLEAQTGGTSTVEKIVTPLLWTLSVATISTCSGGDMVGRKVCAIYIRRMASSRIWLLILIPATSFRLCSRI